ncbi:hypothetical protein V2J09_019701 [Rumex salicifolius]
MSIRISSPISHSSNYKLILPISHGGLLRLAPSRNSPLNWQLGKPNRAIKITTTACVRVEDQKNAAVEAAGEWGKVSAVLFDMDGVLCNSEETSRKAGVDLFAEMGVDVCDEDFVPFMGTGEANFLGGVAQLKGVKQFNADAAKKRFFEIYIDKYAKPNSGIGFPGALELITQCKANGLKVAVASSADRIKVDANLAAAVLMPLFQQMHLRI